MQSKTRWSLVTFACATLFSISAFAQTALDGKADLVLRLCPEDILEIPMEFPPEKIPVGCEVVEARKYLEAARGRKELREDVRAALDESSKAAK